MQGERGSLVQRQRSWEEQTEQKTDTDSQVVRRASLALGPTLAPNNIIPVRESTINVPTSRLLTVPTSGIKADNLVVDQQLNAFAIL